MGSPRHAAILVALRARTFVVEGFRCDLAAMSRAPSQWVSFGKASGQATKVLGIDCPSIGPNTPYANFIGKQPVHQLLTIHQPDGGCGGSTRRNPGRSGERRGRNQ